MGSAQPVEAEYPSAGNKPISSVFSLRGLLLFLGLISLYLLQCLLSMRLMSASCDETAHLPAGYSYWKTGKVHLNLEHPPLIKLISALPLLAANPPMNFSDPTYSGPHKNDFFFGANFLYANNADLLLLLGRIPTIIIGLVLAFYIWRWATDLFGKSAGFLALFFYVTCPNIIAHSRFVTMDIGLACFSTMTLYHWWRYHVTPSNRRQLLYTGVCLGLALGAKFTAILLVPALGLLSLFYYRREAAENPAMQSDLLFRSVMASIIVCSIGGLLVWFFYFCPRDPTFYFSAMENVRADRSVAREFFMLGMIKEGGWYSYFLVCFLLKSQIPFLITLLLCLVFFRKLRLPLRDEMFLFIPAIIFTLVISIRAANFGVRYLLPVYPFLFIFAGRLTSFIASSRGAKIAASFLVMWQIASLSRAWPDYVGYFNESIGRCTNGVSYLDDSNLDWGQDLILLRNYLERNQIGKITIDYLGNGSLEYYKIAHEHMKDADYITPKPGIYVISANYIARRRVKFRESHTASFINEEPTDRIGMGFFVYEIK